MMLRQRGGGGGGGCQASAAWIGFHPQQPRRQQAVRHLSSSSSSALFSRLSKTTVRQASALKPCQHRSVWKLSSSSSFLMSSSSDVPHDLEQGITPSSSSSSSSSQQPSIVVVRRNRQSLEFRKGSQLVFDGAIAYTFGKETLQMADLVQVWVEAPDSESDPNKINKNGAAAAGRAADKSSKTRNKKDKRGKPTSASSTATSAVTYPHYHDADGTDTPPIPKQLNQLIGWGVYNPSSLYRVRILCHANLDNALSKTLIAISKDGNHNDNIEDEPTMHDTSNPLVATILRHKLLAAMETRKALGLPSDDTNTFRLVNGEGDGLSGLAIDLLGNNLMVIMSSAGWCESYRSEITAVVQEITSPDMVVVWKTTPSRLKQDGWENPIQPAQLQQHRDQHVEEEDEYKDEETIEPDQDANNPTMKNAVVIKENGVLYRTYPFQDGQKTGVYCDQRDNKYHLATLCRDKTVLDLCCYHGGFSLTAKLLGGATHCTGVDSSQNAIDICCENALLNGIAPDEIDFVRDDVVNYMKLAASDPSKFWDVIVLDPPKLAPSVSSLDRASRKYHSLNRDALQLIHPTRGGLFLTCTCSAAMTQKDGGQGFLEMVQQAAMAAGRRITLLRTSGAASCHTTSPISYPAGVYLTAALFHVAAKE